jgi:S-adenosylmethionine hydrolase
VTPRITLLTDFGTRDGFVGAVKGVLATLAPGVLVDDVAHDLPRGDVASAARALARYWRRYPEGTVHVVVVDPGMGTSRAGIACAAAGRFLVGPDNGVLTPALGGSAAAERRCVRIDERAVGGAVAPTFHGRDVFAPAAAALATGRALDALGEPLADPVVLEEPGPTREPDGATGEVVSVDRFGNATTNIPGAWAAGGGVVDVGRVRVRIARTYGDVRPGEPVALVDSEGWIEVAVRDGSAAERLGIVPGAAVRLRRGSNR